MTTAPVAFMFPGQGSQYIGMGQDLYESFSEAKEVYNLAEEIAGEPIKKLCFKGPIGKLTKTVNLQIAITAVNISLVRILLNKLDLSEGIFLGHSLGEYSALYATKVLNLKDTLYATWIRGKLMHEASTKAKGAMMAIRKIPDNPELLNQMGISIANWNTPEQVILTGLKKDLKNYCRTFQESDPPTWLQVSGAWHSYLMEPAESAFRAELDNLSFNPPQQRLMLTTSCEEETDPTCIKNLMASQITSPVNWMQSIEKLLNQSVQTFIEIGPKLVLTNLVRKIAGEHSINLMNFGTKKDIENNLVLN